MFWYTSCGIGGCIMVPFGFLPVRIAAMNEASVYRVPMPVAAIHPQLVQLHFDLEDAILFEKMAPKEALDKYTADAQKLLDEWNAKQG